MTEAVLVLTTAENESQARNIANQLVERRLAACVNLIPRIQSVYRWQGKIETAEEFLLIVKTTKAHSAEAQAAIRELHSYDLPECIVIAVEGGSAEYLKWIENAVG